MDKLGKYQIIRELGRGATATVYLGLDPFAQRQVAIKVFHPDALKDAASAKIHRKLFLNEASLVGRLSHPHVVAIYDAVADDEHTYIVMEYVEGTTLDACCDVDRLLPLERVVELAYKCCKALDYACRNGVIHRDIKPANILLSGESEIKISDFGAALVLQAHQITQVSAVGSPAYMSPQQILDEPLTHQTDIYSLGVVIYKLLAGRLPFEAGSNDSLIYQILNMEPLPPSAYRPEVPRALDAIVLKAMRRDLESRYPLWQEMAQDLVDVFGSLEATFSTISDTEKFDTLRGLAFFRNFTDVQLWDVLRVTRWHRFDPGTVILREGDTGDSFFILAHGEVKVTKQERLLTTLKSGECFGEMAYLAQERHFRRSADVVAIGDDVIAIEVNAGMLARASEQVRHQFNGAFLEILVDRLAMANLRLSHLLAEHNVTIY
ncbi:MAG TPA: serine/threonine-protein kinase [Burkholderiales bacterium]|nr:serine/threonine-protein kinase [Burkholderiales bacterium]